MAYTACACFCLNIIVYAFLFLIVEISGEIQMPILSYQSVDLPDRRKQMIELSVFLFLIVPSMVLSFFVIKQGSVGFNLTAVAVIVRDLALVFLVLYFLWNNHEPFSAIGFPKQNFSKEIALGCLLYIPFFFISVSLDTFLVTHGLHSPKTPLPSLIIGKGIGEILLATVLVIVVAFSEETIFRGYLMLRFRGAMESTAWSVILSSFIFSLGHGYEGSAGVVTVGTMGAIFAIVYLWRANLVAPITMHFLHDFIGIVLIPIVGTK
jgi:membrane protease YdiL (CAAX protease family)